MEREDFDVNNRRENTFTIYYMMNRAFIKKCFKKNKRKCFKAIYRPILTFGCESWVLRKRQKSKI